MDVTTVTNILPSLNQATTDGSTGSSGSQDSSLLQIMAKLLESLMHSSQSGQGTDGSGTNGSGTSGADNSGTSGTNNSGTSGTNGSAGSSIATAGGDLAKDAGHLLGGGIDGAMNTWAKKDTGSLAEFKEKLEAGDASGAAQVLAKAVNDGEVKPSEAASIGQGIPYSAQQHGGDGKVSDDARNTLAQAIGSDVLPK